MQDIVINDIRYTQDELEAMELCFQMVEAEHNQALGLEVRATTGVKPCEK
jgi:hypothetical protein